MDLTSIVVFVILLILTWASFAIFIIEKIMFSVVREQPNIAVASYLGGTGATARSEDKEPE